MQIEVRVPEPGDFEELEVIEVHVQAGATVAEGDPLVEVATDKANLDVPAPAAGKVASVNVAEGDVVPIDQILAVLETT